MNLLYRTTVCCKFRWPGLWLVQSRRSRCGHRSSCDVFAQVMVLLLHFCCHSIQLNLEGHPGWCSWDGSDGSGPGCLVDFVGVVDFRVPGEIPNMEPENQLFCKREIIKPEAPWMFRGSIKTGCNGIARRGIWWCCCPYQCGDLWRKSRGVTVQDGNTMDGNGNMSQVVMTRPPSPDPTDISARKTARRKNSTPGFLDALQLQRCCKTSVSSWVLRWWDKPRNLPSHTVSLHWTVQHIFTWMPSYWDLLKGKSFICALLNLADIPSPRGHHFHRHDGGSWPSAWNLLAELAFLPGLVSRERKAEWWYCCEVHLKVT